MNHVINPVIAGLLGSAGESRAPPAACPSVSQRYAFGVGKRIRSTARQRTRFESPWRYSRGPLYERASAVEGAVRGSARGSRIDTPQCAYAARSVRRSKCLLATPWRAFRQVRACWGLLTRALYPPLRDAAVKRPEICVVKAPCADGNGPEIVHARTCAAPRNSSTLCGRTMPRSRRRRR
jgi:hypothetical protein